MGLLWQVILSCLSIAFCQDCNYYQRLETGKTYYIYNPNYPYDYKNELSCSWAMDIHPNDEVVMNCTLEMPKYNTGCLDTLNTYGTISDGGYCTTFRTQSKSNRMVLTLQTYSNTTGGRFLCEVRVEKNFESSCECGWALVSRRRKRLVGGEETGVNEFPMMAALVDLPNESFYCGATIISTNIVLTAAHCVHNRDVRDIGVVVGEHDFTTGSDTNATRLFRVDGFIIHPEWSGETSRNDIAIIKIDGTIQYNERVGPVCLPFRRSNNYTEGQTLTILGWGLTEFAGSQPQRLQKATVNVIPFDNCEKSFGENTVNSTEQICTFRKGKDSCQMDGGGPLLTEDFKVGRWFLAGIVSHGVGCASDVPSVSTRVSAYLDWIVSQTPSERYCVLKEDEEPEPEIDI